jgi:hypothetical protein
MIMRILYLICIDITIILEGLPFYKTALLLQVCRIWLYPACRRVDVMLLPLFPSINRRQLKMGVTTKEGFQFSSLP